MLSFTQWIKLATPAIIVMLLSVELAPTASAASGSAPAVPRLEQVSCAYALPFDVEEGRDASCSELVVPVRHLQPEGPVLRLAVVILNSRTQDATSSPLVVLHGGPGGSAIDGMAYLFADSPLRENRDIILFDQRGSGYSEPTLECPELIDYWFEEGVDDLEGEEQDRQYLALQEKCYERLSQSGIVIEAYTTEENAADVEALRVALGLDTINLYGVSYGAELALAVMSLYPEGVRSVILDSPVPNYGGTDSTEQEAVQAIFRACERDLECSRAYPDLANDFERTVSQLDEDPIDIRVTHPESGKSVDWSIDGDYFSTLLAETMRDSGAVPIAPMIIHDTSTGNYSLIELLNEMLVDFLGDTNIGTNRAVQCGSSLTYFTSGYVGSRSNNPQVEKEESADTVEEYDCTAWIPAEMASAETELQRIDLPYIARGIPTMVLAGRFDPLTTPDYGDWIADQLSNSTSFTIENAGHGTIDSSECVNNLMRSFLDSPSDPIDSGCVSGLDDIDFTTDKEIVRLPFIEIGLGVTRRSPATIGFLSFLGIAAAVMMVGSLISIAAVPAYQIIQKAPRANRLARRWERAHSVPKSRLFGILFLLFSILVVITSFLFSLALMDPGREGSALLAFVFNSFGVIALAYAATRLLRRVSCRVRIFRNWRRYYSRRDPRVAQLVQFTSLAAGVLLTATIFAGLIAFYWGLGEYDLSVIFGLPKSSWLLWFLMFLTLLMGAVQIVSSGFAWRRGIWSRRRGALQITTSLATAVVIGTLAIVVFIGIL